MMRTLLIILALTFPALGADVYVRIGAGGANDGSDWTNAYPQLSTAEANVSRGDTIWVARGNGSNYNGGITFNVATSGTTLITVKLATTDEHGTETGWDDGYAGQPQFDANWTISSDYWTFDFLEWHGGYFLADDHGTQGAIDFTGDHITITGMHFDGPYTDDAGHTFQFNGENATLNLCDVDGAPWEDSFDIDSNAEDITFFRCVFNHDDNTYSDTNHGDIANPYESGGNWDLTFDSCIFYNIWLFGILNQQATGPGDILWKHCVLYNCGTTMYRTGSSGTDPDSVSFLNCTIHNAIDSWSGGTMTNCIFALSGGWEDTFEDDSIHNSGTDTYCLYAGAAYQAATGNVDGSSNISTADFLNAGNPLGTDGIPFTSDDGYRLQEDSDAIDAGTSLGYSVDILGTTIDGSPDMGAYEYSAGGGSSAGSATATTLTIGP